MIEVEDQIVAGRDHIINVMSSRGFRFPIEIVAHNLEVEHEKLILTWDFTSDHPYPARLHTYSSDASGFWEEVDATHVVLEGE